MIRKLRIQLLAIIMGTLTAAFALSLIYARNTVTNNIKAQWTANTKHSTVHIAEYLEHIKNVSQVLSENDIYRQFLLTGNAETQEKIEAIFQKVLSGAPLVQALRVVDKKGGIVIYSKPGLSLSPGPGEEPINIMTKDYFKILGAENTRGPLFSNFELGLTPGDSEFGPPMIRIMVPVYDGGNKLGYLLLNFNVTIPDDIIYTSGSGSIYSFIASYGGRDRLRNGMFLFHPNKEYEFASQSNKDYYVRTVFSEKINGVMENGVSGVIRQDGTDNYIFFNTVLPYGEGREAWKIAYVLDMGTFFSPADVFRNSPIIFIILAVILGVILAMIISRKMISPINNINNAIKRIAEGDLSYRLEGSFPKELRPIAETVNYMAQALQERIEEINENHKKIETLNRLSAMGVLAGGIAHELNSPLNSIIIICSFLAANLPEDKRSDIELIRSEAVRCAGIVYSLRAMSPNRKASIKKGTVNLKDTAEKACTAIEIKNGVKLLKKLEDAEASCESTLISTAAINLLKNAVEAIDGEGTVTIKTGIRGGVPYISVKDTGCGMDEETLAKLPQPFVTTKTSGTNMGIGLCLIYKIMADHDGNVKVLSEKGKGTEFILELGTNA